MLIKRNLFKISRARFPLGSLPLLVFWLLLSLLAISQAVTANDSLGMSEEQAGNKVVGEIERLRDETSGNIELATRLNDSLYFLVRNYNNYDLYAALKSSDPAWVIARGEVEAHLSKLDRARKILELHYKDRAEVEIKTRGLSEIEIIEHAETLNNN